MDASKVRSAYEGIAMQPRVCATTLVVLLAGLAACSKPPTEEECKAAITRMMEIQIDALDAPGSVTSSIRSNLTEEQRKSAAKFLKDQIPSMLTPPFIAQCISRMKKADLQCTMSATTPDELVQKCHWKVGSGPKGATLGF